jgi:predicted membrane-bound spermidine synthase
MLAVVLLGIGLGGLVGSSWLAWRPTAHRGAAGLALVCGAVVVATYGAFGRVLDTWPPVDVAGFASFTYGLPLMLPVALLSGVLFTFLGEVIEEIAPAETRSAGLLTLANTLGAMTGSLVGGFVLLPSIGTERSIQVFAAAYGLAALAMLVAREMRPRARGWVALATTVLFVGAMLAFPVGRLASDYLRYPLERLYEGRDYEVVDVRESLTETIFYLERPRFGEPLYYKMGTNSYGMSATSTLAQRYMKLFVHLPVALHPEPRDALLISYGVGMTAKALTETDSLERIDVVDISRDILEMNRIVYPDPRDYPLADPRVKVHIEDGRHFLQTTDRRYDLITGEPPPPKMAGIVSLYTRQFFGLARARLAPGGLVSYWLPVHDLSVGERDAIISAFCEVFDDCTLWSGAKLDWILLGSAGDLPIVDEAAFTQQWRDPIVSRRMARIGIEYPGQLGALFMADTSELQAIRRRTPPVDDDRPGVLGHRIEDVTGVRNQHVPWLNVDRSRRAFLSSAFVERYWPPALREDTVRWFPIRTVAHRTFFGRIERVLDEIPGIQALLTQTALETEVLWLLGTVDDEIDCARRARARGDADPVIDRVLGDAALAQRRFDEAAAHYAVGRHAPGQAGRRALYLEVFALEMAGRHEEATRLAAETLAPGASPIEARYLDFLGETFGPSDG